MCVCPEGAGDLPVLPFPMRLVRKRGPVIAATSAVVNQLPRDHPARPSPSSAQGCDNTDGFGRISGLSVSFPNAENEEVLKNLLFILKAKIPLEFNLLAMDLKLLQTVAFLFYHGSHGNFLKGDFIANRVFVLKALSQPCLYVAVGDQAAREVSLGTFLCCDIPRAHGGTWGSMPERTLLQAPNLCSAWGPVSDPLGYG